MPSGSFDVPLSASELDRLRLAAIVQSSDDAIISKSLDGVIQSWNPAAEHIFGYTEAEMVGQSIFRLIPVELHAEEHDILRRIRAGEHLAHYETTRVRKDGQRLQIALTVSPIRDASGTLIGASSIKRDVTAQRDLEERLRQAQKMEALGQLAGGVAHDFNNILTIIEGFASFLGRTISPDAPGYGDLLGIRQATERATRLTQQLLVFSRQQTTQPEVFDLSALVHETTGMLRRLLGEHIELKVRTPETGAFIHADRGQLSQVLLNLAVNARDAMPLGGTLCLETRAVGDGATGHVILTVADTGHGMDEGTQTRIFEPFFTTKPRGRGTGLGLAMVFGIVKQAGGTIDVESSPGRGTLFRVTLPRREPSQRAGVAARFPSALHGEETVLVVEDEPEIASLVSRILTEYGYAVIRTEGPGDAMLAFAERSRPIDLLLTDVVMPGMNGRTLAERLRQQDPRIAVLYMSGYTDHFLAENRVGDDAGPLLRKPFSPEGLVSAVRHVLDAREENALSAG